MKMRIKGKKTPGKIDARVFEFMSCTRTLVIMVNLIRIKKWFYNMCAFVRVGLRWPHKESRDAHSDNENSDQAELMLTLPSVQLGAQVILLLFI